jgi:hypothetical protein
MKPRVNNMPEKAFFLPTIQIEKIFKKIEDSLVEGEDIL